MAAVESIFMIEDVVGAVGLMVKGVFLIVGWAGVSLSVSMLF